MTYTVQCYDVEKSIGGGVMSAFSNGSTKPTLSNEQWALETCYPFVEKDAHKAKKTSSKALVMAHAYSNVIMDKIEEAVKNGLVGNESDIGNSIITSLYRTVLINGFLNANNLYLKY